MGRSEGHIHLHDRLRVFTLWKEKLMHIGGICIILGVLYTGTMTWNTVIMFFFFKFLCNWEIAWLKHDLDETQRLWTPASTLSAPELWECGKHAVNTCTGNWGSCFCPRALPKPFECRETGIYLFVAATLSLKNEDHTYYDSDLQAWTMF